MSKTPIADECGRDVDNWYGPTDPSDVPDVVWGLLETIAELEKRAGVANDVLTSHLALENLAYELSSNGAPPGKAAGHFDRARHIERLQKSIATAEEAV